MNQDHLFNLKDYTVIKEISDGSYAEVFKIEHKHTHQNFALKVMLRSYLKKECKQHHAYIQAQVLSILMHEGIIKIHEVLNDEQNLYLVLDYCEGGDMFTMLKNLNKQLLQAPNRQAFIKYYLSQIVQTISYLHQNGIAHRDLKPQNIVLTKEGKIKLVDFGTCKIIEFKLIKTQILQTISKITDKYYPKRKSFTGSAMYISPQALDGMYDYCNDVWALGVIMYKFYHNEFPFKSNNNYQIFSEIKNSPISINESLPLQVKDLIMLLLNKNPKKRIPIQGVKQHPYFGNVDFQRIFQKVPPNINDDEIIFTNIVMKRMYFGNYKKRELILCKNNNELILQYKLINQVNIKRRMQLSINDFAEMINQIEFYVRVNSTKYFFKAIDQITSAQWTYKINQQIRKFYKL